MEVLGSIMGRQWSGLDSVEEESRLRLDVVREFLNS